MPRLGAPVGAWAAAQAVPGTPVARPPYHVTDAAQLTIRQAIVPGPGLVFKKGEGRLQIESHDTATRTAGPGAERRSRGSAKGGKNEAVKATADGNVN